MSIYVDTSFFSENKSWKGIIENFGRRRELFGMRSYAMIVLVLCLEEDECFINFLRNVGQ